MKKSFRNNWKMYGLNLFGLQVIPCYYDVVRAYQKLTNKRYKWNIFQFSFMWTRYCSIFDTRIKL